MKPAFHSRVTGIAAPRLEEIEDGDMEILVGVVILVRLDEGERVHDSPVGSGVRADRNDEGHAEARVPALVRGLTIGIDVAPSDPLDIRRVYAVIQFGGAHRVGRRPRFPKITARRWGGPIRQLGSR